MKLDYLLGKELKEEEYERYLVKVRPAWNRFDAIRKPAYDNFIELEDGGKEPFYKMHARVIEPALAKYEAFIHEPYQNYLLFCEAVDNLVPLKPAYTNKQWLDKMIREEMIRIKTKKRLLTTFKDKRNEKVKKFLKTPIARKTIKERLLKND